MYIHDFWMFLYRHVSRNRVLSVWFLRSWSSLDEAFLFRYEVSPPNLIHFSFVKLQIRARHWNKNIVKLKIKNNGERTNETKRRTKKENERCNYVRIPVMRKTSDSSDAQPSKRIHPLDAVQIHQQTNRERTFCQIQRH